MADSSLPSVQAHIDYRDPEGGTERSRVLNCIIKHPPSKLFLSDHADNELQPLAILSNPSQSHSAACIDIYTSHATLTILSDVDGGAWVSSADAEVSAFPMPVSTHDSKIAMILRQGDSFIFHGGRWSVHLEPCGPQPTTCTQSRRSSNGLNAAVAEALANPIAEAEKFAEIHTADTMPPRPPSIQYRNVVERGNAVVTTSNLESQESIGAEDRLQRAISIASGARSDLESTAPKVPSDLSEVPVLGTPPAIQQEYTAEPSALTQGRTMSRNTAHQKEVDNFEEVEASEPSDSVSVNQRVPHITKFGDFETRISPVPLTMANSSPKRTEKNHNLEEGPTQSVKRRKSGSKVRAPDDEEALKVSPRPVRGSKPTPASKKSQAAKPAAQYSPADSTRSRTLSVLTPRSSNTSSRARSKSLKTYQGPPPCVSFSSTTKVENNAPVMQSFGSFGGKIAKSLEEANMLCIGKGPLKKTLKFVLSIASGKDIITDDWLVKSHRKKGLLDHEEFLPADSAHEREWKFCLREAIERGKAKQLRGLLKGFQVYFTRQLEIELDQNCGDFKSLIRFMGGSSTSLQISPSVNSGEQNILIGVDADPQIREIGRLGRILYRRDLIVMAVLRGELELDSEEFQVKAPVKEEEADEDDEL